MEEVSFRALKKEIRILGIDDAPFDKFGDESTYLIGVVFRGGSYIEGVLKSMVEVDGDDSTDQIIGLVKGTRHKGHLRVLMLSGITFGGLNIVDIDRLWQETGLPVIIVTRKMPDMERMKKALTRVRNTQEKLKRLLSAGPLEKVELDGGSLLIQWKGLTMDDAKKIVRLSIIRGLLPEPIRVAHIIASGITMGDSRGRA